MDQPISETVRRFQAGDRNAFAELVSRFENLVTSTALAETGDFQRSEDVAQQAFLLAWQKQAELKDPGRVAGWLRGIARNVARNERRLKSNATANQNSTIDAVNEPAADSPTPQEAHSSEEQKQVLWSTLERIPVEYREPIILFYREQKSVRAVAELLGLSEDAVKQRLRRGRAMVKEEIRTLVEDMLFDTRPSAAFSAGVMAALPAANATAKTSLLLGVKTMMAKVFGIASIGAWLGLLGGLAGTLGGIYGAWVGTQGSIRHATSDEEKSVYRITFVVATLLSLVLLAAMILYADAFAGAPIVFGSVLFVALMALTLWSTPRIRKLHRKHGRPEVEAVSPPKVDWEPRSRRSLWLNRAGSSLAVVGWMAPYSALQGSYEIAATILVLLAAHSWILWRRAASAKTVVDQLRYEARASLETGAIQMLWTLLALVTGANVAWSTTEGLPVSVPFVVFSPVLFLLFLVISQSFHFRANDLEEELQDGAR